MPAKTVIQTRRDTAANWTSANPTLASGEIGFETDTAKFKIGNGSTAWSSLAYQNASGPQGATGAQGSGVPTGGTAGQILTKSSSTNYDTAWSSGAYVTSFSPTWTGLTIGNGTIATRYTQIGKTVVYQGRLTFGSTTSITGSVGVSPPINAISTNNVFIGSSVYTDQGVRNYVGACQFSTSSRIDFIAPDSTGSGTVTSTVPFTWGNTDTLTWTITYEVA